MFRRRLIVSGIVILVGILGLVLEKLMIQGSSVIQSLSALLVTGGAALELGAVWYFVRQGRH
ncbi:hypothetical protein [Microvirga lotononidis]|uniref:Uncharacterized protein n=1 Tax=Microvirga lotononidis TaxID=864069 RepID=I4Z3H9_9HYPH|nr:hypothetical protein [Microvirga lotononidis]EIM30771.1 hypothetical protein MicloDRAFT_00002980 [Microvirga lotononidis]WQO31725.1 hypothetical protein U0023_30645 [Microvirga lotononidis]